MRHSASLARTKRPSSEPTTIPTADCPKSARNRTSPPGTAASLSVRGIDDMDTVPSRAVGAPPAQGQPTAIIYGMGQPDSPGSPTQRVDKHHSQKEA